ncbi:Glutaredoxin [Rhodoferax sp. OV413]|uniref:glutaredoxin family protein n=1 Tax=Rhodoferax sp. OV413 TaxID=1855285 RepID=UPI000880B4B7|nr:glutaredoxin family protein [Rhodoferax sp. OV413]SDO14504.1 Glutaredoxin [Rhodoferax sp. OV413]
MRPTPFTTTLACAVLALAAGSTQAQTVYRIVGPDGKVSFSDQPPPPSSKAKVTTAGAGGSSSVNAAALPFELKEVVQRYPVTLYTSASCGPCASARNLLTSRGVPFTERTVNSNEDADALKRISGDTSLPFGTIGGQQLKGFSDVEWTQYLDAAAYPKSSVLPATYRPAAPTPLVAKAAAPAAAPAPAPVQQPQAQPVDTSRNPAGIQF